MRKMKEKKVLLIAHMNKNNNIDIISTGYINQIFEIFNNNEIFVLKNENLVNAY